jgi:hypothetical protein
MTHSHCFKMPSLILTLIAGISFITQASAQSGPYLIDLNSRTVTPLDRAPESVPV